MKVIHINERSKVPKYKQIVSSIEEAILLGQLKKGDRLPSLNAIKLRHELSRDTVLVAFNELKNRGIIHSVVGKGYYVSSENITIAQKIFVLFDELNSFKEDLYNSFLYEFNENVQVDVFFHHFNKVFFHKIISDNLGEYNYYVIMPANLTETGDIISLLPEDKVYVLDQVNEDLQHYPAVYQNFKKDMYNGLVDAIEKLQKYKALHLIFSEEKQPLGLKEGVIQFCKEFKFTFNCSSNISQHSLENESVYIVLDDKSLLHAVKKIKESNLQLAKNIGLISYNDSLLKEIVEGGITTISTDFKCMGKRLAQMILSQESKRIENPSKLTLRNSL